MQIIIMRHGDATIGADNNAQRPLTPRGREQSAHMAAWLQRQHNTIEHILVSPYLRTQQTLAEVKAFFVQEVKIEVLTALTPNGKATQVIDYLHLLAQQGIKTAMIISHLPLIEALVRELCPETLPPMFVTASMAQVSLNVSTGKSQLDWHISPQHLGD